MQLAVVLSVTCSSNRWNRSQQHTAEHGQKVLAWQSSCCRDVQCQCKRCEGAEFRKVKFRKVKFRIKPCYADHLPQLVELAVDGIRVYRVLLWCARVVTQGTPAQNPRWPAHTAHRDSGRHVRRGVTAVVRADEGDKHQREREAGGEAAAGGEVLSYMGRF